MSVTCRCFNYMTSYQFILCVCVRLSLHSIWISSKLYIHVFFILCSILFGMETVRAILIHLKRNVYCGAMQQLSLPSPYDFFYFLVDLIFNISRTPPLYLNCKYPFKWKRDKKRMDE